MKTIFDRKQLDRMCVLIEQGLTVDEIAAEFKMTTKDFMEIAVSSLYA